MISPTILAVASTVPVTPEWNQNVGIIISVSCLVALVLTFKIQKPQVGPKVPLLPISIPAFIAAMCFGHLVGVGIVLGLTNIGGL
ncbi:photosystem I reaction center subunit PsaK [Iningainema tapete]|uniref:Photosystem I reaction center subunit PsaK n=1 Tax=Iningainema tapete BLCC-T55 TaxID=2748662 RepID=A0A8J6XS50_9CYAN|nr:photosystem I reaction center subunit PsaK [Iningainema tapete]MBD2778572.1 photosystem I reaction center subunit PsaK [Iningainema tapete BLCC-T55]